MALAGGERYNEKWHVGIRRVPDSRRSAAQSAVVPYQPARRWIEHAPTECRCNTSGYPDSPETVGTSGEGRQNREEVAPFHASAAHASAARLAPMLCVERGARRSAPIR